VAYFLAVKSKRERKYSPFITIHFYDGEKVAKVMKVVVLLHGW